MSDQTMDEGKVQKHRKFFRRHIEDVIFHVLRREHPYGRNDPLKKYESLNDLIEQQTDKVMEVFHRIFFTEEKDLIKSSHDLDIDENIIGKNLDTFLHYSVNSYNNYDYKKYHSYYYDYQWYHELLHDLCDDIFFELCEQYMDTKRKRLNRCLDKCQEEVLEITRVRMLPILADIVIKPLLVEYISQDVCGQILSFL